MSPDRWIKIEEIFQAASELPQGEQAAFVAARSGGDSDLALEVNKLLASLDEASLFIESPVWTDSNFLNTSARKKLSNSIDTDRNGHDEFIGKRIGVYKIVRQIGRGGMGAVYLAERDDGEFQQTVAIKLIKRGMDTDFIVRRFRHERQILASFEHPFIARLLDGGTTEDGTPYFVMEYIEGDTFFNYCDEKRLSIRDRLKLFQKVCSAIDYAHERQIIHRDIKPGNILINRGGSPKLLDFGIAKILDPDLIHESLNPTGSMLRMMTPDYASPEQVRGRDITPVSDVYSLGVLLYELLSGHRPYNFKGRALHEVSRAVCEEMPEAPSAVVGSSINLVSHYAAQPERAAEARSTSTAALRSELAGDLDNIVMKALAKDPSDRYSDVKEISHDITRFLKGSRVTAPRYRVRSRVSGSVFPRPPEQTKAIAVLPFRFLNLGANEENEDKFIGLGLTDALITRLSKIRRFIVRPTSSVLQFDESAPDPIVAGETLGVEYILDGNIKKANDRLRVTVQLLNVRENAAIWATSIDEKLADVLTLEDTLANKVAEALLPQLTGSEAAEFAKRGTDVPEAFEQYLRGRYYFNSFTEDGFAKAFVAFHSAIAADPDYALAYCGIADYYNWLGIIGVLPPKECFEPAIRAASKAVELDDELAEAHAVLGFSLHAGNYDWAGAERHLKRAIELNPANAVAFVWLSIVLFTEGRMNEGLELARRGIDLDPLTPFNQHNIGWGLYYARRYDEAIEQYEKVRAMFPEYAFGSLGLSKVNRKVGNTAAALDQAMRGNELMGNSFYSQMAVAEALAADGRKEEALAKLNDVLSHSADRYVSPYQAALVYSFLGDFENAIVQLESARETSEVWLNWMGVEPVFDPLRNDPRFDKILEDIGYKPLLNAYSRSSTDIFADRSTDPEAVVEAPSRPIHDLTTLMVDDGHLTSETVRPLPRRGLAKWAAVAIAAALALLVTGTLVYNAVFAPSPGAIQRNATYGTASIVVLPFVAGQPENENLGFGLADALSQKLGSLQSLTVIAPNSGRYLRDEAPAQIAESVGVAYVLRGTLSRTSEGAVLEAEFISAPDETTLWRERFVSPDGDYFRLQTQVAEKLWTSLGITPLPLERRHVERTYTRNSDAYENYLLGRAQMNERSAQSIRRAIGYFGDAVRIDPEFAPAYVGLADANSLLNLYDIDPPEDAYEKAKGFVQRALVIDPDLPEAHASLAYINFYYDRDRSAAELEFRRAIQVNPSYAQAHHWFALVLAAMLKPVDALTEITTAERLDPRSLSIKSAAAMVHFYAGDLDLAIEACDRALAVNPDFVPAHKVKRWVFSAKRDQEAARAAFEAEKTATGGDLEHPGWVLIRAQVAPTDEATVRSELKALGDALNAEGVKGNDFAYAYEAALAYLHLGDTEKALQWLERAESVRAHSFNLLEVDPRWEPIRQQPRFRRLLQKLHGTD